MLYIDTTNSLLRAVLIILVCCSTSVGQESEAKSPIDDIKMRYASDLKKWGSEYPPSSSEGERQIQRFESWPAWNMLSELEPHLDSSDETALFQLASLVIDVGNAIGPGESRVTKIEAKILQRIQTLEIDEQKLCVLISKCSLPSKPRQDLLRFCLSQQKRTRLQAVASFVLFQSNLVLLDENQAKHSSGTRPESEEMKVPDFQSFYRSHIDPSHFEFVRIANSFELTQLNEQLYQQCITEYKDELLVVDTTGLNGPSIGKLAELCLRKHSGRKMASDRKLQVGDELPLIEGNDLEGRSLSLNEYRGRIIVLDFWASWCGPCIAKLPKMQEIADKYRDKPVVFVGVNADVDIEDARRAAEKAAITWNSLHFGKESERIIGQVLKVREFPTVYIIDASGILRENDLIEGSDIDKALEALTE